MIKHQQEIDQQAEEHLKKLNEEKTRYEGKEEQLHNQIEFLKSSFHSFKVFREGVFDRENRIRMFQINLEKEHEDNLQRRISEHVQKIRKESEEKEEEMKRKVNDSILKERKNLLAKHKMDLENVRKQHQQEIDVFFILNRIRCLFDPLLFRRFTRILPTRPSIEHEWNL